MELIDEGEFDWQSEEKKERKIKQLCIITIKKLQKEAEEISMFIIDLKLVNIKKAMNLKDKWSPIRYIQEIFLLFYI